MIISEKNNFLTIIPAYSLQEKRVILKNIKKYKEREGLF